MRVVVYITPTYSQDIKHLTVKPYIRLYHRVYACVNVLKQRNIPTGDTIEGTLVLSKTVLYLVLGELKFHPGVCIHIECDYILYNVYT